QILKVAMVIAGFSAAQGDKLRRAMSRARSGADMERLREPFAQGALANGVSREIADKVFHQIAGFADFGFCKSHAAAFALVAYQTAWLKLYYPAEFYVALLNNQPMGFYSPAVIAGDAKRHGDRKSTRLNSSHRTISYAVFCLKKKNNPTNHPLSLNPSPDFSQHQPLTPQN